MITRIPGFVLVLFVMSGALSGHVQAQSGGHHGHSDASAPDFAQRSAAPVHLPESTRHQASAASDTPVFVVVAPELGERRNAELSRLFSQFKDVYPVSELVFVPSPDGHGNPGADETASAADVDRSAGTVALKAAFDRLLADTSSRPLVVLPLFIAGNDNDLTTPLNAALDRTPEADQARIRTASAFGESYLSGSSGIPDGTAHPNILRWMLRSAAEHQPVTASETGIILMPHGASEDWNRAMRTATEPVGGRYVTVDAYSMANPAVVEPAIRVLEERGMKAAVIVRIFSLESSFETKTEYMLGLRDDAPYPGIARIPTHLRIATVGGMEAHPLLAEAMGDRAEAISTDPASETLILVGHGAGGDASDAHWIRNLERIGEIIQRERRAVGQTPFQAVEVGTWREDWPEKRDAAVDDMRAKVAEASTDGGTALVLPVRTIGEGPEARLLEGLEFRLGEGFAPHPNFDRWLTWMIEEGLAELRDPVEN